MHSCIRLHCKRCSCFFVYPWHRQEYEIYCLRSCCLIWNYSSEKTIDYKLKMQLDDSPAVGVAFRGVRREGRALLWLLQTEMLLSSFKWHSLLLKPLISNETAALRWWGQLIRKYKTCICKIKQAADSYTNKVIMAQVLQPNNAEPPRGTNQKLILIIMWILH